MYNINDLNRIINKLIKGNHSENIVFLDYDGVININNNLYGRKFGSIDLIDNLNKLCLNYNLKIVVVSSFRNYPQYKEMLYDAGLDKSIVILGKIKSNGIGRENEIIEYLDEYMYINKFIILDDAPYNLLSKYHIKTDYLVGFDKQKYDEAVKLLGHFDKNIK